MKIVVCAKQVKFTYARTGRDPSKNYIAPEDNLFRINPWDESALDIALKLKEKDSSVEVAVLSLGPVIAERELRRCIALGADGIYRIDTETEYDSWSKAVLLARGIKKLKPEIVFCGKESVDKQNGQVGVFIAHILGLPFVPGVTRFLMDDRGAARAFRNAGKGFREEIECPLPAVFSVSAESIDTRLPDHEQKQKALASPLKILEVDLKNVKGKLKSDGIFPPRPRPRKVVTPDSSMPAFDRISQLLSGSNVEKKGAILSGDRESQVEGIISYLIEHGFLTKEDLPFDKQA